MTPTQYLTLALHGEPKSGKTWLAASGPKPILMIDVEAGGTRFVPGRKVSWSPLEGDPPEGDYDICIVNASTTREVEQAAAYVTSGRHPFRTIVLDSLSEVQDRYRVELAPAGDMQLKDWGNLLTKVEALVVSLRDAAEAQDQIEAFVATTFASMRDGKMRPLLAGAFAARLGFKLDATGYLKTVLDEEGNVRRCLILEGSQLVEAGCRPPLPGVIWDPNLTDILSHLGSTEKEVT